MKILYATLHEPRFAMGGAEQILLDVAKAMKYQFGYEVAGIMNGGGLAAALRGQGISVTEVPWAKTGTLKALAGLKHSISTFRPDIIHSFHRYMTFLLDLFFKKDNCILYTEQVRRRDKRPLFRYGHFATACHETVRRNLIEFYQVPAGRVVTIPNTVSLPPPNPEVLERLRVTFKNQEGKTRILCIGRLEEQKGHRYLIEAAAMLPEFFQKKMIIFLAGNGSLESALRGQIKTLQVGECFHFLGHVREISEYLTFCDFTILPSLWEGLPLSIPESYAMKKAVIATAIPGSKESVQHGQTGRLVPVRDPNALAAAVSWFINHPAEVRQMGIQAYEYWQKEFSFEKSITSYHRLYLDLMAGQKGGVDCSDSKFLI